MADGGSNIRFAVGTAIFGDLKSADVALVSELGFPGIEPYRGWLMEYVNRPRELKALLDAHGVTLCTCSNGGPGQATEFIDPAGRQRTIDDHVAFARDFLGVFGCAHFKINMGARPVGGTSEDDLQALAVTLNALGRRTQEELGIRLAPHPHIWGPIERPHEIARILELTDPAYVGWIPDVAHLNLGGGDPLQLMTDHFDRIVAVHWKDTAASYRGYTGPTPTREQHAEAILYKDLGTGGVDLPATWQLLQARDFRGWLTLDLDPPRANEGEGTIEEKLRINHRYVTETLGITRL
jgi:sugar phosphate isomerase/epimerase